MDDMLVWGLALMVLAAVLLVIEMFVPTGGVLGMAATAVAIAGVVCLWRYNELYGAGGLLVSIVAGPTAAYYGLKLYRHTPLGRKMIGAPDDAEIEAQRAAEQAERDKSAALLGRIGEAITDLHPSGTVLLDGQRYDALSDTSWVKRGQKVRVTGVSVAQLKVRPV